MTGSPAVIASLRAAQDLEATLSLQYGLDASCLEDMGLKKLAKRADRYSDEAEDYLDKITDRILFLEGDPSFNSANIKAQLSITDLLRNELDMEMLIVDPYEGSIQIAVAARDDTTRNLFEHLLKWHQKHIDWIEEQLTLIDALGEVVFIAQKI